MAEKLYRVAIKERYRLNDSSSEKETYHLVVDLKDTDLSYDVGDCMAVYPHNPPESVEKLVTLLNAPDNHQIRTFLTEKANLGRITRALQELLGEKDPTDSLFNFTRTHSHKIPSLEAYCEALAPQLPRFYSIASSMQSVGNEAHLLVGLTQYEKEGEIYLGTCSHYLTKAAPLNEPVLSIYLQKAKDFTLPTSKDSLPVIMIGPGTGVAPFRGFLQERLSRGASGKNWLFFGERNQASDFYYREFLEELQSSSKLRLTTAFSRDSAHKVYVQHRMEEHAKELWQWINEGALIYVCGDAEKMAKEVDQTLQKIAVTCGGLSESQARDFFRQMKKEKRYLRDVY